MAKVNIILDKHETEEEVRDLLEKALSSIPESSHSKDYHQIAATRTYKLMLRYHSQTLDNIFEGLDKILNEED